VLRVHCLECRVWGLPKKGEGKSLETKVSKQMGTFAPGSALLPCPAPLCARRFSTGNCYKRMPRVQPLPTTWPITAASCRIARTPVQTFHVEKDESEKRKMSAWGGVRLVVTILCTSRGSRGSVRRHCGVRNQWRGRTDDQ
jgi:hypothetical protein